MNPNTGPAPDLPGERPALGLNPGMSRRLRRGHPWLFSNEVDMTAEAKAMAPGSLVTLVDAGGERLGVATFNPHTLIAARLLTRDPTALIDTAFLAARLRRALALREAVADPRYCRLVHAEADGLPGLVIDRYGDVAVVQANTAGMDKLTPVLLEALDDVIAPHAVVLRNDSPFRQLEGLEQQDLLVKGIVGDPVELVENNARFFADLVGGQKTGWFYDQRDNRAFVAKLAHGRRVIDLYCYAGGFAIQAALGGATAAVGIDGSETALGLAEQSAAINGVAEQCRFHKAEAFAEMARRTEAGERFDVVVCDPPAFVKSKKDLASGLKGYRKMVRLAAGLVAPEGFLFAASCSHHVGAEPFAEEVARGLTLANRSGRIIRSAGAGPDHPVHPALPESAYLKAIVAQLD